MKNFLIVSLVLILKSAISQEYQITRNLPLSEITGSGANITGLGDDNYSGPLPIGFTFVFYGNSFSEFYISSNGLISFGNGQSGTFGSALPNSSSTNSISFANGDLHCGRGTPTLNYFTTGSAPNRILVINFKNVEHYADASDLTSVQLQIFEGTNKIEINAITVVSNSRPRTIGVQGADNILFTSTSDLNASSNLNLISEKIRFDYIPSPSSCPVLINLASNGQCVSYGAKTITATVSPNDIYTFQWYKNNTLINGANQLTYTTSEIGDYTFKVIGLNNSCTKFSGIHTLDVLPDRQSFDIANGSSYSCDGGNNTLAVSENTSATVFQTFWTGPNGFTSTSNSFTINLNNNTAGVYQVTANYNTPYCGSNNVVISKNVNIIKPSFTLYGNDFCLGSTIQLNSYSVPYNTEVSWVGPNGFSSNSNLPIVTTSAQNIHSGFYTATIAIPGCTPYIEKVGINVVSKTSFSPSAYSGVTGCDSITLYANPNYSSGTPTFTNQWIGPNGFSSTTQNPKIKIGDGGVYTLTSIVTGACAGTYTNSIKVDPKLKPNLTFFAYSSSITITQASYCPGGTISLPQQYYTNYDILWTGPNGFSSSMNGPIINNANVTQAGTYTANVSHPTCLQPQIIEFPVIQSSNCSPPNPCRLLNAYPTNSYNNSESSYCPGTVIRLKASFSQTAQVQWAWAGPNGFSSSVQYPSFTMQNNSTGIYTVTATVGSGECIGTYTKTANLYLTSNDYSQGFSNPISMLSLCEGENSNYFFSALSDIKINYYTISGPNDYTQLSKSTNNTSVSFYRYNISPNMAGNYTILANMTSKCGEPSIDYSYEFVVNINPKPAAPIISSTANLIQPGQSTSLTGSGCASPINLRWNYNYVGSPVSVSPLVSTKYWAVCNQNGCSSLSSNILAIDVNNCSELVNLSRLIPSDNFSSGTILKQAKISNGVITANNLITGTSRVTYQAKNIQLSPGFLADGGTVFKGEIGGCN